jgi:hypothetical protein
VHYSLIITGTVGLINIFQEDQEFPKDRPLRIIADVHPKLLRNSETNDQMRVEQNALLR